MIQRLNNHGSTTSRVLCTILGTLSLLLALFAGFSGIIFSTQSVYDASDLVVVFILLLISFVLTVEGILMFVLPTQIERLQGAQANAQPPSLPTRQEAAPAPQEAVPALPTPEPAQQTAPEPTKQEAGTTQEDTAHMLLRSNDIFATARDIVHAHNTSPTSTRNLTHLASMLAPLDLAQWKDAPTCGVTRLARTGNYWLRTNPSELAEGDYDRFVSTEAAMNIDLALPELAHLSKDEPSAIQATDAYLRSFIDQKPVAYDFSQTMDGAYPEGWLATAPSEWLLRASMVNDAECVRVPFRLPYELRAHAQLGVAVLALEIPRPACFALVDSTEAGRTARARAYALRLTWLLASHAFANVPTLQRLEVVCHEHGSAQSLLCVSYTHELVQRLSSLVHGPQIDTGGFPQDEAIRASFNDQGWFVPVEPPLTFNDQSVAPREWFVYPELDQRALGPRAGKVTGAARVCDLSINENGPRASAIDALIARWHALQQRNCENVVSTLVDVRNSSTDVAIAEACERTCAALLNGSVDPSDDGALRRLFMSDGALQDATARASRFMDGEHPEPDKAVPILREALDPILSFGFYADDDSRVYRYFGSTAERLVFNTRIDDHSREVRLVPDSYYNALGMLASALVALAQLDDALEIANEMMRIAPASVDAAMRKVRALENQSRIFEAAELIKTYAALAATPRDAALAHYRLAYMEWKLGREDLAVVCYQRALTWDTSLSDQAHEELNDLLGAEPHLKRLDASEVVRKLTDEGIPLGFTADDQSLILTSATLLVDDHAFQVAQPLLAVQCAAEGDDVLIGVRRSLDA